MFLCRPASVGTRFNPVSLCLCTLGLDHMMLCQIVVAVMDDNHRAAGMSTASCRHWPHRDSNQAANKIHISGSTHWARIKPRQSVFWFWDNFPRCLLKFSAYNQLWEVKRSLAPASLLFSSVLRHLNERGQKLMEWKRADSVVLWGGGGGGGLWSCR